MRHYVPYSYTQQRKLDAAAGLLSPQRRDAFFTAVQTRLNALDSYYSPSEFNTVLRDVLSHFGVSVNVRTLNNNKKDQPNGSYPHHGR
jgi:hypothetical protein